MIGKNPAPFYRSIYQAEQDEEKRQINNLPGQLRAEFAQLKNLAGQSLPEFAKSQVGPIVQARAQFHRLYEKEFAGVPPHKIPLSIGKLRDEVEQHSDKPALLTAALHRLETITGPELWGNRGDGQRDVNRYAEIKAEIVRDLKKAESVAGNIRHCCERFDEIVAEDKAARNWDHQPRSQQPIELDPVLPSIEIPEKQARGVKVDSAFDPRDE